MEEKASRMGKATAWMAGCAHGMKRSVDNTKQEGIVADCQKQVRRLTFEVGRLTVLGKDTGEDYDAQVSERYDAILALRGQIAEARAAERHVQRVCPHCGEKTVAGMAYCGHCGTKL